MKRFARYLIFAAMTISVANVFAYKIKIKNNTNLTLDIFVKGVLCSVEGGTITPGAIWERETGCCTEHVQIIYYKSPGVIGDANVYTPTLLADMACHGYEFSISLNGKGHLALQEGIIDPNAAAKISEAIKILSEGKGG